MLGRSAMKKSVVSSQMSGSVMKNNTDEPKLGEVPQTPLNKKKEAD
jgi:hypothetical protein